MKRSNLIIIVISIGITTVATFAIFNLSKPKATYTETTAKEPETGGGETVIIDNIAPLSDILLPSQTQAFRTAINTFLLQYLDPNITKSTIIGNPLVNQDGSVIVSIEADAPQGKPYTFDRKSPNSDYLSGESVTSKSKDTYRFTVLINRDNYRSLTITIKEFNYQTVEQVSN